MSLLGRQLNAPGRARPSVPIYVNTGRATLQQLADEGLIETLREHNVITVTDTCTYLTPILEHLAGEPDDRGFG